MTGRRGHLTKKEVRGVGDVMVERVKRVMVSMGREKRVEKVCADSRSGNVNWKMITYSLVGFPTLGKTLF